MGTLALLVLAVIAGILGFLGDRGAAVGFERVAFFILLLFAMVGFFLRR